MESTEKRTLTFEILIADIEDIMSAPVNVDKNLIEQGLNSLQIMSLISRWKADGARVSFSKLMSNPFVAEWWNLIQNQKDKEKKKVKKTQNQMIDGEGYPLTDVQYAYWVGRGDGQVLGGIGCHAYLELDGEGIDSHRLADAWKKLNLYHGMLRTRFVEPGRQVPMEEITNDVLVVRDISLKSQEETQLVLQEVRNRLSHRKLKVEEGKTAGLELTIMKGQKCRIHFDVDLLVADVHSFQLLLSDLAYYYQTGGVDREERMNWSFGKYLDNHKEYTEEDETYWKKKIEILPTAPAITLQKQPEQLEKTHFTTRMDRLSKEEWKAICNKARENGLTPAMVLLCAYAMLLEQYSDNDHFLINMPIFNRETEKNGMDMVVADFSNILLLEVDFKEKMSFIDRVKQLEGRFLTDMEHSDYSGIQVARGLAKRDGNNKQVAPFVFACNIGQPILSKNVLDSFGKLTYMISQTPQVWVDFQIFDEEDGGLLYKWDAVEELFPKECLNQMFNSLSAMLKALARKDYSWKQDFYSLNMKNIALNREFEVEKKATILSQNIHKGFFDMAEKYPDKTALVVPNREKKYSFFELKNSILHIAGGITCAGIAKGEKIGVSLDRGSNMVKAIYGILYAGNCYVPVGMEQPVERRTKILAIANIHTVITDRESFHKLPKIDGIRYLLLEELEEAIPLIHPVYVEANNSAYIIFTSGSTGEPKGVEIAHGAAYNTILDVQERYQMTEKDSILAVSAYDFDLSVFDLFGVMSKGATLYYLTQGESKDAHQWIRWMTDYKITWWNSVPKLLEILLIVAEEKEIALDGLRKVILSGDWIPLELPERLTKVGKNAKLTSMGGATECSIWSNYYEVTLPLEEGLHSIPYGYPLVNQKYKVIDNKGRDCPIWKQGELWIGGMGLAKGYCGNIVQTEEHFVMRDGERWYRTGDMGRYIDGNRIEFLGRQDFQVKIGGFRIELGEIETALKNIVGIKQSTVIAKEMENGEKNLVAFVVLEQVEADFERIKHELQKKIMPYMVPRYYIALDNIPLSANGKVDRKALQKYDIYESEKEEEILKTETEKTLAEIWKEILGLSHVGRDSNYFQSGGDSLTATKMAGRLTQIFQVKITLETIFLYPYLSQMAEYIDTEKAEVKGLENTGKQVKSYIDKIQPAKESRMEPFPLTDIQNAYWVGQNKINELGNVATHYYFEFDNKNLNIERLEDCVNKIINAQGMLRSVVIENGARQQVQNHVEPYQIDVRDLSELPEEAKEEKLLEIREEISHILLDPTRLPMFHITISKLNDERMRMHIIFGNFIFDGFSIYFFFRECNRLYESDNAKAIVPEISFRDYVYFLQEIKEKKVYQEDKMYWMEKVEDFPPAPELPRGGKVSGQGRFSHIERRLDKETWTKIKEQIDKRDGLTPAVVLMSAYCECLARYSENKRFAINLTRFNRMDIHKQINFVMGDFTTLTLLDVDTTAGENFFERCSHLQRQLWRDLDHPFFTGVEFQRELRKVGKLEAGAIIPVVFTSALGLSYVDDSVKQNLFGNRRFSCSETPQVWLDHQVTEENGELILILDYVADMFEKNFPIQMFDSYIHVLKKLSMGQDWERKTPSIMDILNRDKRDAANNTAREFKRKTLYEDFLKHANFNPERPAIILDDGWISYGELKEKAFAIANELTTCGIVYEEPVAIFMHKGEEQIAAALGVMMAGGAYVPIDSENPDKRTLQILEEAKIRFMLSQKNVEISEEVVSFLQESGGNVFLVTDQRASDLKAKYTQNPTGIAYIIYTSGSTGRPKGVVIRHHAAMNTIDDINHRFNVTEKDRTFDISNFNFDLSVYDIFGILSAGGAIVLPEDGRKHDVLYWHKRIARDVVTIWNSVPAFVQMLMTEKREVGEAVRLYLMSGDWIPMDLPEKIRSAYPEARQVSLGGATEASIWSNYFIIQNLNSEWNSIPYGKPLDNQKFYILDQFLQDVPEMVPGELYIAGQGLASGYCNNPEKTKEQFLTHPITGETIYKTGDMGKYMPDGNIIFLGRNDFQVKVAGHRIELGEIEHALLNIPEIEACALVVVSENGKHLHAFLEPREVEIEGYSQSEMSVLKDEFSMDNQEKEDYILKLSHAENFNEALNQLAAEGMELLLDQIPYSEIAEDYLLLMKLWKEGLQEWKQVKINQEIFTDAEQMLLNSYAVQFKEKKEIYRQILTGEADSIELLLEDKFPMSLGNLSSYNLMGNEVYLQILKLVKQLISRSDKKDYKVRILEIGSRVSDLNHYMEEIYHNPNVEYLCSDESEYRRELLNEKTDVLTVPFHMDGAFMDEEERALGKFDIILADNTLHRAKDCGHTLRKIKNLLSEKGVLLCMENARNNLFMLTNVGILEKGFGSFTDGRKQPLMCGEDWKKLAEHSGYISLPICK